MTREEFRFLAAGQIAYQRRGGSLDFKEMETYVEGALFGFDFAMRMIKKDPSFKIETKAEAIPKPSPQSSDTV